MRLTEPPTIALTENAPQKTHLSKAWESAVRRICPIPRRGVGYVVTRAD